MTSSRSPSEAWTAGPSGWFCWSWWETAVLALELENRGDFAASISDRGDEYFDEFTERHTTLLAQQAGGR
jgi:hypothetical protein